MPVERLDFNLTKFFLQSARARNDQLSKALSQTKGRLETAFVKVEQVKTFTQEVHGKCFVLYTIILVTEVF